MTDDDLKRIGQLIDERVSNALSPIQKTLGDIQKTQEVHTGSLTEIENMIQTYGDAYNINKDDIEGLDKRVTKIEEHLNIPNSNN